MSKQIFLVSNTHNVIQSLVQDIGPLSMRVAFITTASEVESDATNWLSADRRALAEKTSWDMFEYTLTGKTAQDLRKDLAEVDILYLTGGNVFYLLQQVQKSGFAEVARAHVNANKVYIGQSAGAIIAGPNISPAYRADKANTVPKLHSYKGLSLVDFIVLPHWGSKQLKDVYFKERLEHVYTEEYKFLPLTDYQYVQVADSALRIVDVNY